MNICPECGTKDFHESHRGQCKRENCGCGGKMANCGGKGSAKMPLKKQPVKKMAPKMKAAKKPSAFYGE